MQMGCCLSSGSGISKLSDRANVISANGDFRQYTLPITVSQVLILLQMEFPISLSSSSSSSNLGKFFVCNSDKLFYDEYINAMDEEDGLEPDQIYFVLPSSKLQYRLAASDMAALAVKATLALQKSPNSNSNSNNKSRNSSSFRQNRMARISPILIDGDHPNNTNNKVSDNNPTSIRDHSNNYQAQKKKLQRYSSKGAKMAVRSFRIRLTTIYEEGAVRQF